MEFANVELRPEGLAGLGAQSLDLQLAEFVTQCLPRPDDVAIDFRDDEASRRGWCLPSCRRWPGHADQPSACMPVSTTRRQARWISPFKRPNFEYGSL